LSIRTVNTLLAEKATSGTLAVREATCLLKKPADLKG